jgi:hypothetical protein
MMSRVVSRALHGLQGDNAAAQLRDYRSRLIGRFARR